MDRRNKVWLTLLAVLLVAAVAAVVIINTRLADSRQELQTVSAQLASAQEKNNSTSNELSAANAIVSGLASELNLTQEAQAGLEAELTAAQEAQAGLEAELTAAQEAQASLESQLTEAQSAQAGLESQLAEAQAALTEAQTAQSELEAELSSQQEWALELESQLLEAQTGDLEPGAEDLSSLYSVFTVHQAADAFNARSAALTDGVEQAQARADELLRVMEALDENIVGLNGDIADGEEAEEPGDAAEVPAADGGSELLLLVPEVQMPAVLNEAAELDLDDLYAQIDSIVTADEAEMSAEEKVAALKGIRSLVSGYVNGLNDAVAEIAAQQTMLTASMDGVGTLEAEYAAAQQTVEELNAAISDSEASVAFLTEQVAALSSQSEEDSTQIAMLNAEITAEQAITAELTEQLNAALAERDSYLAALEAYRADRSPNMGEAHAASTLGNRIAVAADGKSANWHYVNNAASGNSVELSIELDGEEIYHSANIAPGAAVESFTLNRALEAGEYEAVAITRVYEADGSVLSTTRVPVTVAVE